VPGSDDTLCEVERDLAEAHLRTQRHSVSRIVRLSRTGHNEFATRAVPRKIRSTATLGCAPIFDSKRKESLGLLVSWGTTEVVPWRVVPWRSRTLAGRALTRPRTFIRWALPSSAGA